MFSFVGRALGAGEGLINLVYSFTSNFELLLTRGIRLFNKNKALRSFFGL